jgi:type IV pilus assembly protein PilB
MLIDDATLKKIIKELNLLKPEEARTAAKAAAKAKLTLAAYLVNNNLLAEDALYQNIAKFFKTPFADIKGREIKPNLIALIPTPLAVSRQIIAFAKEGHELKVAMLDPLDLQTVEFVRRKTGLEVKVYLTTPSALKEMLQKYHASLETELQIVKTTEEAGNGESLKKIAEDLPTINIVNSILDHAVFEGASDIHIEPMEKELLVRYRVDGILRPVMTLPKQVQAGIVARIKILANLKIDEHMQPQDGRIKLVVQDEKFSLRVSVLPVYDGEKVVIRLLKESTKPLTLDQLGFLDADRAKVESALEQPHGILMVTGPTGSGKSTTLYSILNILNEPGVNISTIEDPIEYRLKGINQSQVNPRVGYTFASGLRSFLRQDPDIIMVGEIRDLETAEIAMHAAMTGHLVLSTLHTNDAPTSLPRLLDMGIPSFLIAFTAKLIVAQRLVRKICQFCKKEYALTEQNIADLEKMIDVKRMLELFKKNGCLEKGDEKLRDWKFYYGAGCSRCGNQGYKGRVGIYEVLEVNKKMAELINRKATTEEIRTAALTAGFTTILEDGLIKAKKGITSLEEVLEAARE